MAVAIISRHTLRECGWENVIQQSSANTCSAYLGAFQIAAENASQDSERASALKLLSMVCSMYITQGDRVTLGPKFQYDDGSRSLLPQDLPADQVTELVDFIQHVDDPELLARLADTIWLSKHAPEPYKYALVAIEAYANSGKSLCLERKINGPDRFSRAISLARELGKTGLGSLSAVYDKLIDAILCATVKHSDSLVLSLLRLAPNSEIELSSGFAYISERIGDNCAKNKDYFLARDYMSMAVKWHEACKDSDESRRCDMRRLYLTIEEADNAQSKLVEASALQRAVEIGRQLKVEKKIIDDLFSRLLVVQEESTAEMKLIQTDSFDATEHITRSRAHVSGCNVLDSLFRLSFITRIHSAKDLEEEVHRQAAEFPLSHIMPLKHINHRGRVVAYTPGLSTGQGENPNETIRAHIHKVLLFKISFEVQLAVEPARMQILNEHTISDEEMFKIVIGHPLVPQGSEAIWARGLRAGFEGDFLVATHLLVPQIESSLRHVLEVKGGRTTKLSSAGIQEEISLDLILNDDVIVATFGKDLVFTLQALLVEKTGSNFRNLFAHGLLSHDDFYAATPIYLWWLALRVICIPLYNTRKSPAQDRQSAEPEV